MNVLLKWMQKIKRMGTKISIDGAKQVVMK